MKSLSFSTNNTMQKEPANLDSIEGNVYFLTTQNPVPNIDKPKESIQLETPEEYLNDIKSMSATQLKGKYKLTYDSWKNMKQRCKNNGFILDIKFDKFVDFLTHMGPRTNKDFTLDRIDSENLNYGPGLCRWADKHTQNQNKGNNVHLSMKGETHTVSVWAKKTGQNADTLYKRKSNGWSDEEVITGVRKPSGEKKVRASALKTEDLLRYLEKYFKLLQGINKELEYAYDLNGPEFTSQMDLVAQLEKARKDYYLLLNEIKRRHPTFEVTNHFRHLI